MWSRRKMLLLRMENAIIRRLEAKSRCLVAENQGLMARCRELERNQKSPHDPRTGALTAEYFDDTVEKLLHNRHRRLDEGSEHIALVMVDLDLLKPVNDSYGHASGDEVLRSFSEVAQNQLRENDLVARYGGDEFTILLRGSPEVSVQGIIEKLRHKFEGTVFTFHRSTKKATRLHPSFSFGVALYRGKGDSLVKMLARADKNMYAQKKMRKASR
ncbi:MAG: GGDEF domain-containing protein [bacterium]|nr:GGDEF domain-containing protein [bacterium]